MHPKSTHFDRGRNDSSSDVFLIGGGVASRSNGGGELTCKSSFNLTFDSRTQNGIFPSTSCLPIAKLFCHCVWEIRSPRMQTFDILPACTRTHHSCWINNKGDKPVLRPCSPSSYHLGNYFPSLTFRFFETMLETY